MILKIVLNTIALVLCVASAVFSFMSGENGYGVLMCVFAVLNALVLISYAL